MHQRHICVLNDQFSQKNLVQRVQIYHCRIVPWCSTNFQFSESVPSRNKRICHRNDFWELLNPQVTQLNGQAYQLLRLTLEQLVQLVEKIHLCLWFIEHPEVRRHSRGRERPTQVYK